MRFSVRHQTTYRYSAPVRLTAQVLRFSPRPDAGALISRTLTIEPEPIRREETIDRLGNLVTRVDFTGSSDAFRIESRFEIEVAPAPALADASPPALPWLTEPGDPNAIYVTGDAVDGAVRAFARKLAVGCGGEALAFLGRLNETLYRDIRHDIREEGAARPPAPERAQPRFRTGFRCGRHRKSRRSRRASPGCRTDRSSPRAGSARARSSACAK